MSVDELSFYIRRSGFKDVTIDLKEVSQEYAEKWGQNLDVGQYIMSGAIQGRK